MKSRTSFFDSTILKKNITRFAPAWGLYLVFLLLIMGLMVDRDGSVWYASNLAETTAAMAILNFAYALVVAQLLFGDLYSSRMCNALHALPLRREGWFITHLASGLLFSLVPNLVMTTLSMFLCGSLWQVPLCWLAAMTLEYLFFFGVAVLSSFLVGSRFAMAVVYLIINLFSLIVYWLADSLYAPSLYGIIIVPQLFFLVSPVYQMASHTEMIVVDWDNDMGRISNETFSLLEGWGYAGICAGIGILAIVLALLCYRKRHLECAGDFMAMKRLEPVILVLYTLCIAACCHGFFDLFLGTDNLLYLTIGLTVGFFTGKMLLERQVRVFRKKNFLGYTALILAFFATVLAAQWDLFGAVRWIPQAEKVESVSVSTGGTYYYMDNGILLTDTEDIEKILFVHQEGLNKQGWEANDNTVRLQLTYEMKSGMRRSREYRIYVPSEAGQILKDYLSSPDAVLGELKLVGDFNSVHFYDPGIEITDPAVLASLRDAIIADCEAGNMAQDWGFYPETNMYFMSLRFETPDGIHYYKELRFWDGCENIMKWIDDQSIEFAKYE